MEHESDKIKEVNVSDTSLGFEEIYLKPYTPQEHINEIKRANVLLIPNEGFREKDGYFFPECTDEFLQYLKDKSEDLIVDICISNDDYQKIELHSDVVNVAMLIVQWAVFPILTSMIGSYLYDKAKKANKSPEDINAAVNIIVEKTGKATKITYNGSIENFESAMHSIKKNLK